MLANNFKSPEALGISDIEFQSLFTVMGMLERGEIKEGSFDMRQVMDCGTPSCIAGWSRHVSNGRAFPQGIGHRSPMPVLRLFAMTGEGIPIQTWAATPSQAAIAVRNFLTSGEPRWAEALAAQ